MTKEQYDQQMLWFEETEIALRQAITPQVSFDLEYPEAMVNAAYQERTRILAALLNSVTGQKITQHNIYTKQS